MKMVWRWSGDGYHNPIASLLPHTFTHTHLECLPGHLLAECGGLGSVRPGRPLCQQLLIVRGVHHDRHVSEVLGGGADHGGPTDVDVLDADLKGGRGRGGDGLAEGVEVDNDLLGVCGVCDRECVRAFVCA